jgi:hypothetical protein
MGSVRGDRDERWGEVRFTREIQLNPPLGPLGGDEETAFLLYDASEQPQVLNDLPVTLR